MKRFTFVLALLALIVIGLVAMPAFAQESTPAPDATPVIAVDPVPAEPVPDTTVTMPLWLAFVGGAVFLLGGALAGGGSVFMILTRWADKILKDPTSVHNAELLANGMPPWSKELLLELSRTGQALGRLGEEVFDGVPVETKETSSRVTTFQST